MTGSDENLLTTKSLIQSGQITDKIMKRVIIDDVDINSLLLGDKYAILVFARIYSLGTDYEAIAQCEYCREIDRYQFDISNVPVKYLHESANQVEPYKNRFKYVTSRGNEIIFRLSTVGVSKEITDSIEAEKSFNKKNKIFNKPDRLIYFQYIHTIESINDVKERKAIDEFLSGPITESREFNSHVNKISPGVEFKGEFYCTNCGKVNKDINLEFNENFFWPDIQ